MAISFSHEEEHRPTIKKKEENFQKNKKEFYSKVDEELKNKMIIYLPTKMVFRGLMFLTRL